VPLRNLVFNIDTERQQGNLSSAIRLFVLGYYQKSALLAERFVASDHHPRTESESVISAMGIFEIPKR
jgi:predicted DNA-binding ribbon-helix-helix protein